jgi:hypothetical protein
MAQTKIRLVPMPQRFGAFGRRFRAGFLRCPVHTLSTRPAVHTACHPASRTPKVAATKIPRGDL